MTDGPSPAERHRRVKEIFFEAAGREGEERVAYLDSACGDDAELRADVDSLLEHHDPDAPEPTPITARRADTESDPAGPGDAPAAPRFAPGVVLGDRFRIVSLLGRGGMGEVYRAEDLRLSQTVALKFLPPALASDPTALARFHREARVAREITHPNVCRVHDVGLLDGEPFLSMEYIDGEELGSLLVRIGRLPSDKATELARQLCAGLSAAHARGVIHRDLKPANVMIDGRGQVRITDFGIAKWHDPEVSAPGGTPAYMAPELLQGARDTRGSVQSDLYALGLVLYEMYTGHPAFEGRSLLEISRLHAEETPSSPSSHVVDLDPLTERVILDCLEKDPSLRPASAMAVAAALPGGDILAAALAAGETPSPEMVAAADAGRSLRPRTARALGVALTLLVVLAVLLLSNGLPGDRTGLDTPPRVLAAQARTLLVDSGFPKPPADEAYGFRSTLPERLHEEAGEVTYLVDVGVAPQREFWYRSAEEPLVADDLLTSFPGVGHVTPDDPEASEEGDISVRYDARGRLVELDVMPPIDGAVSGEDVDWDHLLEAAGLSEGALRRKRRFSPFGGPAEGEEEVEWHGERGDGERVKVDAYAFDGRPMTFRVWLRPSSDDLAEAEDMRPVDLWWIAGTFDRLLLLVLLAAASFPAWRHLRAGLGDRRGALRLGSVVCAAAILRWVLDAHHTGDLDDVLPQAHIALAGALFQGAVVWTFYVALEPFVRRFWPQTVVSWTRLLGGRGRDRIVGRDLLAGTVAGAAWTVVAASIAMAVHRLGWGEGPAFLGSIDDGALLGLRGWVSAALASLLLAIYVGLGFLLALCLLRALFGRTWPAGIVAASVLAAAALALYETLPPAALPLAVAAVALGTVVLLRLGLVALVTAIFVSRVLMTFPVTFDVSAWYADAGMFALALVVVVAIVGYRTGIRAAAG